MLADSPTTLCLAGETFKPEFGGRQLQVFGAPAPRSFHSGVYRVLRSSVTSKAQMPCILSCLVREPDADGSPVITQRLSRLWTSYSIFRGSSRRSTSVPVSGSFVSQGSETKVLKVSIQETTTPSVYVWDAWRLARVGSITTV